MLKETVSFIGLAYSGLTVRLNPNLIQQLGVPSICPNCLKPADQAKKMQTSTTYQAWGGTRKLTVTVGFGTHPECGGGWRNRNISGSVHIALKGKDVLEFRFREPLFAKLFITINFPLLSDNRNNRLSSYVQQEIQKPRLDFSKACSRCGFQTRAQETSLDVCPTCGFAFQDKPPKITLTSDVVDVPIDIISCPNCHIEMMAWPELTTCGRCGFSLSINDSGMNQKHEIEGEK